MKLVVINPDPRGGSIEGTAHGSFADGRGAPPPALQVVEGNPSLRAGGQVVRVRLETSLDVVFAHPVPTEELLDAVVEAVATAVPVAGTVNIDTVLEARVAFDLDPEEIWIEEVRA